MSETTPQRRRSRQHALDPAEVLDTLRRHLLVDGFHLVFDPVASHDCYLVDARDGSEYLDLYSFFASAPLGFNPPELVGDAEFMATLATVASSKPSNSDIYSTHYAEFVETFSQVLGDPALPHLFFVEGGGLAVENALKCAFDWKSRRNEAAGRSRELGSKVMHLTRAFHGRTGYTMSLTNTDPTKTDRYPRFDWPRIDTPAIRFPLDGDVADLQAAEQHALAQARAAFEADPYDIACFVAEPIQGEGGDNHMRAEFLQSMQALCHEFDALFVIDEVQTGVGLTGSAWAYQQLGLQPDIVAFAKKVQVGGIMAGRRVDEVPDNVFTVSGRINSTWGGGLVDMVRSRRYLQIIADGGLIEQAAITGAEFLRALRDLAAEYPSVLSNVRGRGLMIAADLPTGRERDTVLDALRTEEHILCLPSGERAIRFRPPLNFGSSDIKVAVDGLRAVLTRTAS